MGLLDFVEKAPCREADPWLFDQYQLDLAQPGLNYCRRCPFWQDCNDLVKPRESHYDGIAAGKVWRNGKVLARLVDTSPFRLVVADERNFLDAETVEVRRGELLGD
jgi:hypothetical protein